MFLTYLPVYHEIEWNMTTVPVSFIIANQTESILTNLFEPWLIVMKPTEHEHIYLNHIEVSITLDNTEQTCSSHVFLSVKVDMSNRVRVMIVYLVCQLATTVVMTAAPARLQDSCAYLSTYYSIFT